MATATEVIIGLVLVLAVPLLLLVAWLIRRRQKRRRAALELKYGNQIYSEWRRSSANLPLK